MKLKVTKLTIILNAIIWAAALLIGSYFFNDKETWTIMFVFLIGGYSIVNSFLSQQMAKQKGLKQKC
jgi:ABC-type transport system involved in multi-copper enzyme maturation permease subunit